MSGNKSAGAPSDLAERCIVAAAEVFRDAGEVLASGIGIIPRLAVGLAKQTLNPDLLITDGEAYLMKSPLPQGEICPLDNIEGWLPYAHIFDLIYRGNRRHALVSPSQIDRFGQTNISFIGDARRPKAALLGARGFAGNSIYHPNSMFVPRHSKRVFVEGEVDMVSGLGYNRARWPKGAKPIFLSLRRIITNLAVMDFGGADDAIRVIALHPGVSFEMVQAQTGFALARADEILETEAPDADQLRVIEALDPDHLRGRVFA